MNIKIGLGILAISALFGFLEKFLALDIQSRSAQEERLRNILQKSSEEFDLKIQALKLETEGENIGINAEVDTKKVLL